MSASASLSRAVRRLASPYALGTSVVSPRPVLMAQSASTRRMLSSSGAKLAEGKPGQKDHVTDKEDRLDVQSNNSGKGFDQKAQGSGGSATSQSDSRNSTKRTKEEHPESPVIIGMQDERGGKGR
ncbi:hypothetical protein K402DRAFT_408287 [Aulographum hederae CBS 113979]|uniref:Uncharacterized protein n=1 Tax=Aulographum hederae CBS 113979 TaxID=1176131 RepID=A0A6G1GKX5_9PEZI|nr:hypothetical protein K402DRAFT_408287 [Aulographum hederae CBS 113979]